MRRALRGGAAALLVLILGVGGCFAALSDPLPEPAAGTTTADADALARQLERAVDAEAWAQTGAVSWTFAGRNAHLWDKDRHLARVRWKDTEVLLDLTRRDGRATVKGEPVHGKEAEALFEDAWARWANDSFWLNPLVKLFDEGTARAIVPLEDGGQGLLLTYSSGGVTPGDSYLWIPGPDGRPTAWKMWVSIIPIGGVETSWDGWQQLSTGAWVATLHEGAVGPTLELTEVQGAASLAELTGGDDPFAPLFSP